jgi:hypothetical protein
MSKATDLVVRPSSATRLIKARAEYIKLATTYNSGVSGKHNLGEMSKSSSLRLQAFITLSKTYDEYVKLHGDPEEGECDEAS